MAILVRNLELQLDEPEEVLVARAARRLRVPPDAVERYAVVRRSLDARRRHRVLFSYNLQLVLSEPMARQRKRVARLHRADTVWYTPPAPPLLQTGSEPLSAPPVIVGFGPAGMLAAYRLAELGYTPIVLERGQPVPRRHRDILHRYYRRRDFDAESNLLFGEGGAGAYSDGKLYTRVNDPRVQQVLEVFYQHGASPDILIDGKPHVGSDKLPRICWRLRERIESRGGQIRFAARVLGLLSDEDRRVVGVELADGQRIQAGLVILAIGHSARDTYRWLARCGVAMQARPFQLGVRIEHPQAMVDRWQYGTACGHQRLPPATYQLVARGAAGEHGNVFSFCVCPGGRILPANESPGQVAVNGASRSARSGPLANSGLVMTLPPPAPQDPLAGVAFLEGLERRAFELGGGDYAVPCQRACDLVAGRASDGELRVSFPLGGRWVRLRQLLPTVVAEAIARGLEMLDRQLPGYAGGEGIVTAPETRASTPVRVMRDPGTRQSLSHVNLYPTGEGAGYAGGILSAAIDGLYTAEMIAARYRPMRV